MKDNDMDDDGDVDIDMEDTEPVSEYLDRAAIRRAEEKQPAHDAQGAGYLAYTPGESPGPMRQKNRNIHSLTTEESRYLGGSDNTTHLVRGLDTALLQRVREELAQASLENSTITLFEDPNIPLSINHSKWGRELLQMGLSFQGPFGQLYQDMRQRKTSISIEEISEDHQVEHHSDTNETDSKDSNVDLYQMIPSVDKPLDDLISTGRLYYRFNLSTSGYPERVVKSIKSAPSGPHRAWDMSKLMAIVNHSYCAPGGKGAERMEHDRILKAEVERQRAEKHRVIYEDEDDIFGEVGRFDTNSYAAKELESTGVEEDLEALQVVKECIETAEERMMLDDEEEKAEANNLKRKLVTVTAVGEGQENPFGIKNSSLVNLADIPLGEHMVKRQKVGAPEGISCKIEGEIFDVDEEYGITQIEDDHITTKQNAKKRQARTTSDERKNAKR